MDSTVLASQLDPEELREVVRAYQETCAKVIARFEGHIAQYLGDGLLVYFGYPQAHEDDAQRAVRAGLGIVDALGQLNPRLERERGVHLGVRLGCHTGLAVVGAVDDDALAAIADRRIFYLVLVDQTAVITGDAVIGGRTRTPQRKRRQQRKHKTTHTLETPDMNLEPGPKS